MTSDELVHCKEHLASLEAFMGSRAYTGFLAARDAELRSINETILTVDPVERADEIEHWKLRGEKRCLEHMIVAFEDGADELRDRIAEIEESEMGAVSPNENKLSV